MHWINLVEKAFQVSIPQDCCCQTNPPKTRICSQVRVFKFNTMQKTILTRQILKDNFGFDITDCGEFWLAEKDKFFKLIQPKSAVIETELYFFHTFTKITIENLHKNAFKTVEDLQEFCKKNYIELKFTM